MPAAPLPQDEAQRLMALHALDVLDQPAEPAFEALTRLAAAVLEVPVATISLVDMNRQWFLAPVGLDIAETPREQAFCAHAILEPHPLVVLDARDDPRFADNPLVTGEPGIRAYAGVPLRSREGHAVGTLCVLDAQPRQFSDAQLARLQDLALLATRELQGRERSVRAQQLIQHGEAAAQTQEALFRVTLDSAAIGIGVVDLEGRWVRTNPKLCEIQGRTPEALEGLRFHDLTHPDDLAADLRRQQQLLDGQVSTFTMEKRYLRPGGEVVWGNLTVSLVRDAQGQPTHFVMLLEDVGQRRHAEEALQRLWQELEQRVEERTQALSQANRDLLDTVQRLSASEQALQQSREDLRAVLTHAHDAYICIDPHGVVIEWNRRAHETFGWSREEALGRSLDSLIVPGAMRDGHRRGMERMAATGVGRVLDQRLELPAQRRDGSVFPCEITITQLPSVVHGQVYAAFLHDISARKASERLLADANAELARRNRELGAMLDTELLGIAKFKDRQLVWANRAFERLFGYEPGAMVGLPSRVIYPDDASHAEIGASAYPVINAGGSFRGQRLLARRDGSAVWVDMNGTLLSAETGESLWMMQDISAMKAHEREIEALAFRDTLTGLPNRLLLMDRLRTAVAAAQRHAGEVAVAFVDLDGFKAVNDTHGHDAGDAVLRVVAQRLSEAVREMDTVARLGGDEFVLLLPQLPHRGAAEPVLARARHAVEQPVRLPSGATVSVGASIGLAWAGDGHADASALLSRADQAMYDDKRERRG